MIAARIDGELRRDRRAAALEEYAARHALDEITGVMNRVCDEIGENDYTFLAAAGRHVLDRVEW